MCLSTFAAPQAGRQCAAGDNGLAGHTTHPRDNEVVLAGKSHWWRVVRLSTVDCSLVNLVDQVRAAAKFAVNKCAAADSAVGCQRCALEQFSWLGCASSP